MAIYGLRKLVVDYGLKLHEMIDAGADADALHIAVAPVTITHLG